MFGLKRKSTSSGDKLLEQLLGKKAAKGHQASKARVEKETLRPEVKKPSHDPGSEDEEEGRASMIKSKTSRKRKRNPVEESQPEVSAGDEEPAYDVESQTVLPVGKVVNDSEKEEQSSRSAKSKRRGMSYMDQLLEEKARKKKKKQG